MAAPMQEEKEVSGHQRGQDTATLAVVREATGPLMHGAKWRAWLGPLRWLGSSQLPAAVVA